MAVEQIDSEKEAAILMFFDKLKIETSDERLKEFDTSPERVAKVIAKYASDEELSPEEISTIGRFEEAMHRDSEKADGYDSGIYKIKANITLAKLKFENGAIAEASQDLRMADFMATQLRDSFEYNRGLEKPGHTQEEFNKIDVLVQEIVELGELLTDLVPLGEDDLTDERYY